MTPPRRYIPDPHRPPEVAGVVQRNIRALADRRAGPDPRPGLRAGHGITGPATRLTGIARRTEVTAAAEPEPREPARALAPETVPDAVERPEARRPGAGGAP